MSTIKIRALLVSMAVGLFATALVLKPEEAPGRETPEGVTNAQKSLPLAAHGYPEAPVDPEKLTGAQEHALWWLYDAMASWTKVPQGDLLDDKFARDHREPGTSFAMRLMEIARAVVTDDAFIPGAEREALDLVAIAFEESGFRRWVDDGSCNTQTGAPRPAGEWSCDDGRAYTVWQLRPDLWWTPAGSKPVTGADLLASHNYAASRAWEKYLSDPRGWSTWHKAEALARRWAEKHPMP